MRILELAPYALLPGHKGFERNKTGLAVVIGDICTSLSETNEVYLLTQSALTDGFDIGNLHVLPKTWKNVFCNSGLSYLRNGFKACKGLSQPFKYKLKVIYYFLSGGYAERVIKEIKPEIVHIHGIGCYTLPFMIACVRSGVPFVVTLHGVISFLSADEIDEKQRKLERQFCELASKRGIPVTLISSGIKRRFMKHFNIDNDVFSVVLNGFRPDELPTDAEVDELKNKLGIKEGEKVFICVGSVGERKNQIQVVRAFNKMDEVVRNKSKLIFAGNGSAVEDIKKEISKLGLTDKVICLGHVSHEQMNLYYAASDINVSASKDEGFGLPMIEAMYLGVPTVTFSDLDAVPDLYDEKSMIIVDARTDEAFSHGMEQAYNRVWDKKAIKDISRKYTVSTMADNYMKTFEGVKKSSATYEDFVELL